MNKIFTQIALGVVCLFANVANAQVTETFQGTLPTCWTRTNATIVAEKNSTNNVISFSNNGNAVIGTPYIKSTGTLSISFDYKLSSKLQQSKTRTFEVGYQDVSGNFVSIHGPVSVSNHSGFLNLSLANVIVPVGSYQIIIRGAGDGANDFVMIDNLTVTGGTYHYADVCNALPNTSNDTYAAAGYTMKHFDISVLANDADTDNGEVLTAEVVTPSVDGNVVMNSDGTFTFKPNTGFTGTSTTFTYRAIDNGYEPTSRTATVTINFTEASILPIHFMSFSGNANGNKAQLTWSVAENETGSHFEVEKSTDGKKYQAAATVLTSATVGAENYNYTDVAFVSSGSFYRIKVINKDGSSAYSKTVFIKGTTVTDNKIILMQNPVQTALNFSFTSATDETAEVAIYNMAGVKMHSQMVQARKGNNSISLGMDSKFIKGSYILTVQSTTANKSIQLIKQ